MKKFQFLEKYVPTRVTRAWEALGGWVVGPDPPRPYQIRPFFPMIQVAPIRLLDRYCPKKKDKITLLIATYVVWFILFVVVLHKSAFAEDIPGYGSPTRVTCHARHWDGPGNECGVNGRDCSPFDNATFAFRCPASCEKAEVLEPYAVGGQIVNYRPLVIGGPKELDKGVQSNLYRGDSFICPAAIHAGFSTKRSGGCGVIALIGEQNEFPSTKANGIESIGFDSYFPLSYSFVDGTAAQCPDLRWPLFSVSLTFTILISLFTTDPAVFFYSIFVSVFMHVALASDPPSLTDYYTVISLTLGRFLPSMFIAYVMFRYPIKFQLTGLTAQFEKTVLWLGACWVGAFNNYTFDRIPISRLTPHDLKQQPGAIPALVIIVLSLLAIALGQAWCFRVEGRMPRYLKLYAVFVLGILIMVAIPKMSLRIHHYILALLLLPGTALQTRPSLIYQGLLIGLFINGIARWGFDSILQTPDELRGGAQLGSLLPVLLPEFPKINLNLDLAIPANITFAWAAPPIEEGYDGVSVLVNDVERFNRVDDGKKDTREFAWERHEEGWPEYFRFAYLTGKRSRGDYTKAGTWDGNGTWIMMEPGPSK
ncbi:LCCL domain-containing protein [Eremomyces bilateralis CBS 781.70]|uniref:LCCL domain-containing protein n=1 Tax=Eremomyces bilateralis CBS 781.70 TaxID=1392243 RepID=A0A6G1G6D6_9PEZI|nr:LCCL domain-containing protein [Eremomyces bilateralis CBS 781.70]KAF1813594.1 LCCL domain-containing protein [Eremomyces bilateralis CBS 781.70]